MNPKARYEKERSEKKQERVTDILDAAERVFTVKGLEKATMQDIANEANLGVATIFRFFPKKDLLVIGVASRRLEAVLDTFQEIAAMPISCFEKIERLFEHFETNLDPRNVTTVKVIENFDVYASHFTEPMEGMEQYNAIYREISAAFSTIIQQGVEDGSIRSELPISDTLTTIINVYASYALKLSLQSNILVLQADMGAKERLQVLKTVLLSYLKS